MTPKKICTSLLLSLSLASASVNVNAGEEIPQRSAMSQIAPFIRTGIAIAGTAAFAFWAANTWANLTPAQEIIDEVGEVKTVFHQDIYFDGGSEPENKYKNEFEDRKATKAALKQSPQLGKAAADIAKQIAEGKIDSFFILEKIALKVGFIKFGLPTMINGKYVSGFKDKKAIFSEDPKMALKSYGFAHPDLSYIRLVPETFPDSPKVGEMKAAVEVMTLGAQKALFSKIWFLEKLGFSNYTLSPNQAYMLDPQTGGVAMCAFRVVYLPTEEKIELWPTGAWPQHGIRNPYLLNKNRAELATSIAKSTNYFESDFKTLAE